MAIAESIGFWCKDSTYFLYKQTKCHFLTKKITKKVVYVYCCIFGEAGVVGIGDIYIVEAIVVIVFIGIIDGLL